MRSPAEPRLEPYGDSVFECIDPNSYLWEIYPQPVTDVSLDDAADATRGERFGSTD